MARKKTYSASERCVHGALFALICDVIVQLYAPPSNNEDWQRADHLLSFFSTALVIVACCLGGREASAEMNARFDSNDQQHDKTQRMIRDLKTVVTKGRANFEEPRKLLAEKKITFDDFAHNVNTEVTFIKKNMEKCESNTNILNGKIESMQKQLQELTSLKTDLGKIEADGIKEAADAEGAQQATQSTNIAISAPQTAFVSYMHRFAIEHPIEVVECQSSYLRDGVNDVNDASSSNSLPPLAAQDFLPRHERATRQKLLEGVRIELGLGVIKTQQYCGYKTTGSGPTLRWLLTGTSPFGQELRKKLVDDAKHGVAIDEFIKYAAQ